MNALLEKARQVPVTRAGNMPTELDTNELELHIAVTKGELTASQAAVALDIPTSNYEQRRNGVIKTAIRLNVLKLA